MGAAAWTAGSLLSGVTPEAEAKEIAPFDPEHSRARLAALLQKRTAAAKAAAVDERLAFPHATNGDEELYATQSYAGNFSKTMPHNPSTGLVTPLAYQALLTAVGTGTLEAFDQIPRGGGTTQLNGPLSPLVFQMEGKDSPAALSSIVPPAVASAAAAAELVEVYWEAYLRDVPFIDYDTNSLVGLAVAGMNLLSGYAGPKPVTRQNMFRYPFIGCSDGPYVSQLLYQSHMLDGAIYVPMILSRAQVTDPDTGDVLPASVSAGVDYLTNLTEYLFVQDGNGALNAPNDPPNGNIETTARFIRSARDLGSAAASDSIFSFYFRAAIFLRNIGIPTDPNIPYNLDPTKRASGFSTFSVPWLYSLIGRVQDTEAQTFYQKWYVHRKLRPEAFSNLVDGILTGRLTLSPSLHPDLLNASVLPLIFERNRQLNEKRGLDPVGSYFCPQESPGGSPSHPSSPSGHAFTAGACITMLKAIFDLGTPGNLRPWPTSVSNPFVPSQPPSIASQDGLSLIETGETDLTVLGELNKLAVNISEGRNMSSIHYRVSDNMLGLTLGEDVAIYLLNEMAALYPEEFVGFILTKFDGTTILVGGNTQSSDPARDMARRASTGNALTQANWWDAQG